MITLTNIKDNNLFYKNKNYYILIIFLFINFFILFINISFFVKNTFLLFFKFKNVDLFSILLSRKSYKEISNNLNNKYFINRNKNSYKYDDQKVILIKCVDFLNNHNKICYLLQKNFLKKFIFIINTYKPDYLFYDLYGCKHLDPIYDNTIKIAYYSENIIPDFNQADYAFSHAHFTYLDRYFKFPRFLLFKIKYLIEYNKKIRKNGWNERLRNKFCAAVISNNHSYTFFRLNFINKLNEYKKVDMGGRALNNIGMNIKNKIEFLSKYKFLLVWKIVMERGISVKKLLNLS